MKDILIKNIRFLAILASFLAIFAKNPAFAEENYQKYVVEDVLVNVEGDSPADARNLAFKKARKIAFSILLNRLGKNPDFIDQIKNEEITSLVRSEQIFDEKIYGNNYNGNFRIYFAKDFVDDLFLRKRVENQREETTDDLRFLVVPVKMLAQKNLLWESGNDFKKAVEESIEKQGVGNFITAEADIDNLAVLNAANVTKVDSFDLEYLFNKYKADIIYLTFFSYDQNISKASVLIRGFERLRRFQYRLGFINSNSLDDSALVQRVGSKMVNYLSNLKLAEIRAQGIEKDMIGLEIPVRDLRSWLKVKERIEKSGFVTKLDIQSVSRDYIKIAVLTNNSLDVVEGFAKMGFDLTPRSQNAYLLTF